MKPIQCKEDAKERLTGDYTKQRDVVKELIKICVEAGLTVGEAKEALSVAADLLLDSPATQVSLRKLSI